MKYTPTKQQQNILTTLKNTNNKPVLVQAVVGIDFPFCLCYN